MKVTSNQLTDDLMHISPVKGRDIVIVSLQPWYYELGSNCKNIATHFAKHNRVLYINIPITRKIYLSGNKTPVIAAHCQIIKEKGETIKQVAENIWEYYPTTLIEPINSIPFNWIFRQINRINNRRFAGDISAAIKKMNFSNIILFNDNDIYNGFHLKELLRPAVYIYYMRDFLQGFPYWKKHTSILEPKLIRKSDIAVANSTYYADYCLKFNKKSYYIGQGCNVALFTAKDDRKIPEDLQRLARPLIGYVGAIDSVRLDMGIIEKIATHNPEWSIVMVGPEDNVFLNSSLHKVPNIHFLGRKPMELLPDYVASFDVCINPQLVNNVTLGNYPLKIDEYLSMGKPVVATRTKAMKLFEKYTYLADSVAEYPALIEEALQLNDPAIKSERIIFASNHTWENSMKKLYEAISQQAKPG